MTYNVFGGTSNLTQSINERRFQKYLNERREVEHSLRELSAKHGRSQRGGIKGRGQVPAGLEYQANLLCLQA